MILAWYPTHIHAWAFTHLYCKHFVQAPFLHLSSSALGFLQCSEYQQRISGGGSELMIWGQPSTSGGIAKWDSLCSLCPCVDNAHRHSIFSSENPLWFWHQMHSYWLFLLYCFTFLCSLPPWVQQSTSKEISYIKVCEQGSGIGKPLTHLSPRPLPLLHTHTNTSILLKERFIK